MSVAAKPLRQTMPTVAAWAHELRDAFGADGINAAIRNGVAGGAAFYATEGGHTIGRESMPGRHVVSAAHMVIAKSEGTK
jgi:diadenosine tetraphosphate (Ap4A) HIT family hydrolase